MSGERINHAEEVIRGQEAAADYVIEGEYELAQIALADANLSATLALAEATERVAEQARIGNLIEWRGQLHPQNLADRAFAHEEIRKCLGL